MLAFAFAGAVATAAVLATLAALRDPGPTVPALSFWVLDADPERRAYEHADRNAFPGWHVDTAGASVFTVGRDLGAVARLLGRIGIDPPAAAPPTHDFIPVARASKTTPAGTWSRVVVRSGPWPDGADPDPSIAGAWEIVRPGYKRRPVTLAPDGTCAGKALQQFAAARWGRAGDLLLFGSAPGANGATGGTTIVVAAVPDAEADTWRLPNGDMLCRAR